MENRPDTNDWVTVEEAARMSGLSGKAIRRRVEKGQMQSIAFNGRRLILRASLPVPAQASTGHTLARIAQRLKALEEEAATLQLMLDSLKLTEAFRTSDEIGRLTIR